MGVDRRAAVSAGVPTVTPAAAARRRGPGVFTVVVGILVALAALPVLLLVALTGTEDPAAPVLGTVLAALPVVPLVACYLWLDRYEPEPRTFLALGLFWGAFLAVLASLVIEGVGGIFVGITDTGTLAVVAPIAEESAKGLFLLVLLWWRRAELDGILDGIVYAGLVGIGFAFTENILYLAAAYNGGPEVGPGGIEGLTATFIMRCLFSPFAHPFFTAMTGIGVGIAVSSRSGPVRLVAPVLGWSAAVITHALWNAGTVFGIGGFAMVYVVLMFPAFIGAVILAVWARTAEQRLLRAALGDAAARGLVPATDIGWVVDLRARRHARAHARQHGGPIAERAMKDYQQAVIELGFLHHRFLRGTPPPDFVARGQEYVARIGAVRPVIAFPGQVVPTR